MFKNIFLQGTMLVVLTVVGAACSKTASNNSGSVSAASVQAQSPYVSCKVTSIGSNGAVTQIMTVNNLTQASNYSQAPQAPATIKVDCGNSVSASGGAVTISANVNGAGFVPLTGSVYNNIFATPSLNTFAIKATDASGNASSASFSLPVACSPSSYSPIALNLANNVSLSQGAGGPGYLNVSVPAASGGSGHGFTYAIDLNGDGRFDDYLQQYWNASPSWSNMYSLYNGSRNVTVTAFDVGCNVEAKFTTAVNFLNVFPAIQSGATAQAESYYYLQGQVDTTSSSSDPADTVHPFDAMENAIATPNHVLASYVGGQFDITGSNFYSDGNSSTSESLLNQEMELAWTVTDAGKAGSFSVANVPITKLVYQTAASPDGLYNQYTYQMATSCMANVTISRQSGVVPCTTGTGTQSPVTTIQGTYSCPSLVAPGVNGGVSRSIKISNGYFYVQVAPSQNCVGGGGGGGGQPPPAF